MSPSGLLKFLPVAERLQSELKHPFWLSLLLGDEPHNVLIESLVYDVGVHVSGEAVLVFLLCHLAHKGIFCIFIFHFCSKLAGCRALI